LLLILLHGFPEFWWAWRNQITPIAESGFHVVVPDLRGYNLSDKPKGISAYRLDLLAADVIALADSYGADRFRLVGHDWGGVIAWSVGALRPDRLDCLVIMDAPHPDVLATEAFKHPLQALRSVYVALFQLPWLPETVLAAFGFAALRRALKASARGNTFEPSVLDRYAQAWAHPGSLRAMLNYYRALRKRRAGQPTRIASPTLVLWGERDSFLGEHVARASLGLCDDGRLTIIAGATHWLHLEEPRRVNAEILAFLSNERELE
jgi:pimeloyl-ACP methyl ester carboxylesterase